MLGVLIAFPFLVVSPAAATPPGQDSASAFLAQLADSAVAVEPAPADDFAASTDPPWNPPRAMSKHDPWEAVLRFPGRLISYPISGLGWLGRSTFLAIEERGLVSKTVYVANVLPQYGVLIQPEPLGDRTGVGGRLILMPPPVREYLTLSVAASTRGYNDTQISLGKGPARIAYGYEWRPQERFHGLGLDSRAEDASSYALQTQQVNLTLVYPSRRRDRPPPRSNLSAWFGPREAVLRTGRDPEVPSFEDKFPSLAPRLDERRTHLVYGGAAVWDRRWGVPHWGHGFIALGQVERFDKPVDAFVLRETRKPGAQFTRYTAELETGFSIWRDPRTIRIAVRMQDTDALHDTDLLLFSDLVRMGGDQGVRGYEPRRFYDIDKVTSRVAYLLPLSKHLELDVHGEAGGVYEDLWKQATIPALRTSFGVTLRPRLDHAILGRLGVDWSREGARIELGLGGQ
jgi:hypothetical protein